MTSGTGRHHGRAPGPGRPRCPDLAVRHCVASEQPSGARSLCWQRGPRASALPAGWGWPCVSRWLRPGCDFRVRSFGSNATEIFSLFLISFALAYTVYPFAVYFSGIAMSCLRPRRRAPAQRRVVPSRSDVPLPDAAPGCEDPPPPAPRFLSGEDPAGAGWAGRRARRGLRSAARPVWVPGASRARKGPGTRRAWWPFADERRADEPAGRAGAAPRRADSAPLACVSPAPGPPAFPPRDRGP